MGRVDTYEITDEQPSAVVTSATTQSDARSKLRKIQSYVKGRFHPAKAAFVLPQTSVPACLASKALWAAFISWSFGSETFTSNLTHAIAGIIIGLIFGISSFYAATSGTNKLLKEIDTTITDILIAMGLGYLPGTTMDRLNTQIEKIPAKPQSLSWSQIVNVAFAWYTATITSFTFAGAIRDAVKSTPCVPNISCSGVYPAFPIAVAFAALWGVCALLLAYYGQREQAFLTQVSNKLKELIANNPVLNAQLNKSADSVAIGVGAEKRDTTQTPCVVS